MLLGAHPRALRGGCLLAVLPAPLLADIVTAAVELDTCRIEIDMTVRMPLSCQSDSDTTVSGNLSLHC